MYVQNQNLRCSCKHGRCRARLQTVFGSWVSRCIRISLRDVVQCIRSPPAPEAAFWGSCCGFCRTEIQEVTESFLMHLRWEHGFDLTKPRLSKTKTTSCTYSVWAAKYPSSSKKEKSCLFFFFPLRKLFSRAKSFCILPLKKGDPAFGAGLCQFLKEFVKLFSLRQFELGIKWCFEAIFHCYLRIVLWGSAKWRTTTDIFDNIGVL